MSHDVICGDALTVLSGMESESVHCLVTSPPYLGLRRYLPVGHPDAAAEIGLEDDPQEYIARLVAVFREARRVLHPSGCAWINLGDSYAGSWGNQGRKEERGTQRAINGPMLQNLEPYPDKQSNTGTVPDVWGLKPKDLMLMPHRVAMALQQDGWWVRSDICWVKRNPMPESITDRPTKAHEYVFLLAKAERYYFDAEAIAEPALHEGRTVKASDPHAAKNGQKGVFGQTAFGFTQHDTAVGATRNRRSWWDIPTEPYPLSHFAVMPSALVDLCVRAGSSDRGVCPKCLNPWKRMVSKTGTPDPSMRGSRFDIGKTGHDKGYVQPGDRFLTVTTGWEPTCRCGAPGDVRDGDLDLIDTPTGERIAEDPTIVTGRAGMNRPRGPLEGSRPITRYEQRRYAEQLRLSPNRTQMERDAGDAFAHYIRTDRSGARPVPQHLLDAWIDAGWLDRVTVPTWTPLEPIPSTILDPFSGSGTVASVAKRLGRSSISVELNPAYVELIHNRINGTQPPLPMWEETELPA